MRSLDERKHNPLEGDIEWGLEFCGVPMCSNYYVFHQMSKILNANPQIEQIIEYGTYTATMSMYLGMEGIRRGIPVYTYNIEKQTNDGTDKVLNHLGVNQIIMDIYKNREEIFPLLASKVTYLICDAQTKKDDAIMSVPHLKEGSIFAMHDFGVEVIDSDIEILYKTGRIMPIKSHEANHANCQFANFKVIK